MIQIHEADIKALESNSTYLYNPLFYFKNMRVPFEFVSHLNQAISPNT